ncbi:MAG TPA: polysaccharide pyruvyl transferase family protein [Hanamia sp.]|nr:polysaccharide pyruvyl transferase family protein [Hanamia sp.]
MSRSIYFSCAPSGTGNGANMGMQTVDFAIYNILEKVKSSTNIFLTTTWPAYSNNPEILELKERDNFPTKFSYGLYQYENLEPGNAVFFWGDFQWGFDYQVQSAYRLKKNILKETNFNDSELKRIIENRFLLKNFFEKRSESLEIFSYGTTLFQNRLYDFLDTEYFDNLKWLIGKSGFIKFRDPYSANFCSEVKNDFQTSFQGVDAALLSTKDELLSLPLGGNEFINAFEGQIGYYFGRSSSAYPKYQVTRFVKKIQKELNKKLVRIPWAYFSSGLFTDTMDRYFKFFRVDQVSYKDSLFLAGDILKGMAKCSLIITDTYHIAINGINLGIPVLMIPEFRTSQKRDANMGYVESWRDKRVLLYQSNSLSDLLVLPDLLIHSSYRENKIQILKKILEDSRSLEILYEPILRRAQYDRNLIENLLNTF